MSGDDLSNPGPEDGKLISLTEDHERAYWCKALEVDRAGLESAVAAVGHGAAAVRAYLGRPALNEGRADDVVDDYPQDVIDNPPCGVPPIEGAS